MYDQAFGGANEWGIAPMYNGQERDRNGSRDAENTRLGVRRIEHEAEARR